MILRSKKIIFLFIFFLLIFTVNLYAQTEDENDVKLSYEGIYKNSGHKIYFGTFDEYRKNETDAISAEGFTLLMINGSFVKKFNVPIDDGIAFLPIKIFEERMNVKVNRYKEKQKIEMIKNKNKIVFDLKENIMLIHNGTTKTNEPIKIIDGEICISVRKAAENLGFTVGYDKSLLNTNLNEDGYLPVVWIEEENENLGLFSKEEAAAILKNFLYVEIKNNSFVRDKVNESNNSKKYYTDIIESIQCIDGFGRYYFVESSIFYDGQYHKKSGLGGNQIFIDKHTGIIYEVKNLTSSLRSFEIMIENECEPLMAFFVG